MSDKEKIFGSPSDYPFSSGNTNKIEVRKRISETFIIERDSDER
jgi:hypothetical protein